MRFSISSGELLKNLQIISGAIPSNPVIPVLEDFLFDIKGNTLTITASDLDTTIKSVMDVRSDESGSIAIPGKILLETLKSFPEQPLTFNVSMDTKAIEITSSYGKYRLAGESGEDFPEMPAPPEEHNISIEGSKLKEAISTTIFATTTDEMRMAMTGVYFAVDMNDITVVATDAHKLVKYEMKNIPTNVVASFIVPKKGLSLLKGAMGNDDSVSLSFDRKNAFFSFGNTEISCRLIDQKFPDYTAVIPQNNNNILTISRTDILGSLKRIAIYANKTTNQVSFNISDGSLTVSAQDLDFSNEATEQLTCQYEGEPMTISFNAKFMIEMLNALHSENVRLELSSPNKAGLLYPDQDNSEVEIMMLVMPVMTHG
ncbi:MAG TPA: DNA polymerase III subunit beta [Saprospiraceae bacterium]|nr:DNA polymerase III subunit beta [Saprospiraceae bacterium]